MKARSEFREVPAELVRVPESLLGHVYVDRKEHGCYVKDREGNTLFSDDGVNWVREQNLVVCVECGAVLIEPEEVLCITCESSIVMRLLELRQSL